MIKRRFYKLEHVDKNEPSDSSSSSSDSELEAEATAESEDDAVGEVKETNESCSTSSGYESEDSSANEIDVDLSGLINEDDAEIENDKQILIDSRLSGKRGAEIPETQFNTAVENESVDFPSCILKCRSVLKCKMCPRIVCLTEETMRAHLNSKRHARSEKLLKGGRLKAMLNSDGEIENQETAAEMHARVVSVAQDKLKKKNKGRQRQRKRSRKQKGEDDSDNKKARQLTKSPAKKRRKS